MEMEAPAAVRVEFQLGSETYFAEADTGGLISGHLVSIKERSMTILKDFITKHNIPNDVPDDPEEQLSSSDEDDNTPPLNKKSKNQE